MAGPQLHSERLLLRRWRQEDLKPFARMNADSEVMEHFPATLSVAETEALIQRFEAGFEHDGYGLWAVGIPGEASFIGFVGLERLDHELPFAPGVEVGWRLAREFWGRGLASEAASAAIDFAFEQLELSEIVAYTAERNLRSRRLMERLGMTHDPAADFAHPKLPAGHPLEPHVLYRIDTATWHARTTGFL